MTESYEFRIAEDSAAAVLGPNVGEPLGAFARKIEVEAADPLVETLRRAEEQWRINGRAFLLGWEIRRSYSQDELDATKVFHLQIMPTFEPAGEECGTRYEYDDACGICGAGRSQVGPLRLDPRRIPRSKDLVQTIAGDEWLVSDRVASAMDSHGIRGVEFREVFPRTGEVPVAGWRQVRVIAPRVTIRPPTRAGSHPLASADHEGECSLGDTIGLNVLSELYVQGSEWDETDVGLTRQFVGIRRGLLVPRPQILISPNVVALLREIGARGWRVERAHLV